MIPISILFFLLIIILILIICSIIVGSVQVREISGGKNKYFEKNKYFGGANDTLFTEIMGSLKLTYRETGKVINSEEIKNIINTAYKTKYGIENIFDKKVDKNKNLFQYYADLNLIDNNIYLSSDNINSIQGIINGIIEENNQYVEDKDAVVNNAIALNMAIDSIKLLNSSNSLKLNKSINGNNSDDSSVDSDDSSTNRFYPQQLNKSPVILPSSENSSQYSFLPIQSPSRSSMPRSQSLSPMPRSRSRSISPLPLSPLFKYPERSSSPSQSQFLQNSRSNQRHNPPLRGRLQNDSSFDEELNMAEINAKNTESVLGDIKDNLYSKMNQDQKNQEELYKFVDNIRHTEYQ